MNKTLFNQKCELILGVSGKSMQEHLLTLGITVDDIMRIDHRAKCEETALRVLMSQDRREVWITKDGVVLKDTTTQLGPSGEYRPVYSKGRGLPGLDHHDDRRDRHSDGSLVSYQGTFGKHS